MRHDGIAPPQADLLGRAPFDEPGSLAAHWTPPLVDVVDQLEALAALLSRGLLSDEDFARQKRKVLARRAHGAR